MVCLKSGSRIMIRMYGACFLIFAALGFGSILGGFQRYGLQDNERVMDTNSTDPTEDTELFELGVPEVNKNPVNYLEAGNMNDRKVNVYTLENTRERELTERVYRERVKYAMSQCYVQEKRKVENVLKHDEHKLAYCKVPKVGCTFWMRMLLYLYNDTGGKVVKSPFEIPRYFVHFGRKRHLKIRRDFPKIESQLTNYTRFMFARDPYSRLWSAYLDKYRLPDFWNFSGFRFVKRRNVTSEKTKRCRHDISFKEFLQYVTSQSPQKMNEHWQPISYHCDPCLFKPTVIGKVETFNDDAKYILRKIGYEEILSSFNGETYVEEELAMLSEYNFDLLKKPFYRKCLTERDVALLLWEVFQLNGYLPKEVDGADAIRNNNITNKKSFKNFVINYYKSASKEDKHRWKLQKAAALKDAFKSIPKSLTDRLVTIYKDDFTMFGYDSKPPAYETIKTSVAASGGHIAPPPT